MAARIKRGVVWVILSLTALVYLVPLLIVLTNSFMPEGEIYRHYGAEHDVFDHARQDLPRYVKFTFIPENITVDQYYTLLFKTPEYLELFMNSLKLTLPIVLMHVTVGTAAAYGFTVWRWRYKEVIFFIYMVVMVLHFQATLIPHYLIADAFGILNTHRGIILPWGFNPFAVFVMRQSMKGVPPSLLEAAQLDGASHGARFIHIVLPMSAGGAASLAVLSFTDSWAMVEQPLVFLTDAALEPLSVMLYKIGQGSMGMIFAASVFYMLPAVWLFLYGREHFERGISLSAIK